MRCLATPLLNHLVLNYENGFKPRAPLACFVTLSSKTLLTYQWLKKCLL